MIVTWTGEADVDLLVEEPSGTVCSLRNPRTTAGGVLLGDAIRQTGRDSFGGHSEVYVCPRDSTASTGCWSAACGATSPPERSTWK